MRAVRGDDPNATFLLLFPSRRPEDWGNHQVSGTQQSAHGHSSNRPSPTTAAWSYRSALSQLRSGCCSRLQSYRQSVGWADDPTCPDCHSTDHTVAHLFSCPTHPKDLVLRVMCVAPLQVAQSGRASAVWWSAPSADQFWFLSLLPLIPIVGSVLFGLWRDHFIFISLCIPVLRGGI